MGREERCEPRSTIKSMMDVKGSLDEKESGGGCVGDGKDGYE